MYGRSRYPVKNKEHMEGSEKRLILAIALCILIWIIFAPKEQPPPKKPTQEAQKSSETKIGNKDTGIQSAFPVIPDIKNALPRSEALENYTLENNDVLFELSNKGGLFTHLILKRYKKEHHSKENIDLILRENEEY